MTVEERIDPGADVIGSGGDKLGTVAYVVVNPNDMHIADVVVSTGAILGRDVVVPYDRVDRVADGQVYITLDKDQLAECKDYVDIDYQQPPEDWVPPTGFAYPMGTMLWPTGNTYYPEPASVTVNTPPGTVGLHEGMDVLSSDGHKVGSIDALETNPASGDVTALVVKHGFIFTHDTGIPADHVKSIEVDQVKLDLSKDEIEAKFQS